MPESVHGKVAFFPSAAEMAANPYWTTLAAELTKLGVHLEEDTPEAFDARWLLRNRQATDILHIHYIHQFYMARGRRTHLPGVLRFAFRLILARALGYRTVFTLHNLEPTSYLEPRWLDTLGHWVAANIAERVIVHCEEARRLLRARYGRSRDVFRVDHPNYIGVYPNSIPEGAARKELHLPAEAIVFLFFGGIRTNKGVRTLIEAFRNLGGASYRLVIAGDATGNDKYAQELQRLALGDARISFHLRRVADDEIQLFMNAADVVVLPFARVLTSGSAILAMSFGRPIIAARAGCLPELVGSDAGWLFQPEDVDSLARTMQVAAQGRYVEFGRNALRKASGLYPSNCAEQTIQVYSS